MKENPAHLRSSGFWRKVSTLTKKKLARGKTWARLKIFWVVFSVIRAVVWAFKAAQTIWDFIEDHFG